MMFLDLDNFKTLNDAHGHEVGDLLLIEVANRLGQCVREIDTVARFGGDEFVVLLYDLNFDREASTVEAQVIAEKIRISLAQPYVLAVDHGKMPSMAVRHHCTASIGVALFLDHEGSAEDILNGADSAMYKAKEAGRNMICFHAAVRGLLHNSPSRVLAVTPGREAIGHETSSPEPRSQRAEVEHLIVP